MPELKGDDSSLLSGFLDERVFLTDDMVEAAINYIEGLSQNAQNRYIPNHVARIKQTSIVEYNGEY
ncbi:hypothetical protein [Paenibacillus ferrarius]|uniref:hypothetical protein n=1 Tax=Paenibacillus ferrarius TaxID=1469647 RepID=UPI001302004E|nr:hypothetical protein [Paenibacillus ferrarius]